MSKSDLVMNLTGKEYIESLYISIDGTGVGFPDKYYRMSFTSDGFSDGGFEDQSVLLLVKDCLLSPEPMLDGFRKVGDVEVYAGIHAFLHGRLDDLLEGIS